MKEALIIVDMVNDFVHPSGSMYLGPHAQAIVPRVKAIAEEFLSLNKEVFFACDQHFHDDPQFISGQWPPHCICDTWGSKILGDLVGLDHKKCYKIVKENYNAFQETWLGSYLLNNKVSDVVVVGVATDICVLATVMGASELGLKTHVVSEACAALTNDQEPVLQLMKRCFGTNIL